MEKILFVCGSPPHPTHKLFAESMGADFYYCGSGGVKEVLNKLFKMPRGYDIYFTEGLFTLAILSRIFGKIKKSAKIINLFSDPRLHQIVYNGKFNTSSLKLEKYNFFKKFLIKKFIRKVDGAICVGKYEKSLLETIERNMPSRVVYPLVDRKIFFNENVNLKNNNILFIGNGPDYNYKGVDYLLNIFEEIKSAIPNSELFIIGGGWKDYESKIVHKEGVNFLGKKNAKEIIDYMHNSSLYCHFGRGEAFGVVVLEAMAAGLPVFLSNETGAKEVVSKANKKFIANMANFSDNVDFIVNYLSKTSSEKIKISKKFKSTAESYGKKDLIKLFKSQFDLLVQEVHSNEKK
jgi:glycosyltransferase involved in cell wall biosynthesis